jgi:sulfatase maturation enzyme AslB (radical SAM superfamily)
MILCSEKNEMIIKYPLTSNEMIGNTLTGTSRTCSFGKSCTSRFISIDPEGDVYPCGRFSGVKDICLGNINEESLIKILGKKEPVAMKVF